MPVDASPQLKETLDKALRQQRDDSVRIGQAMRALPASDTSTSPALFAAIARAYRNALVNAKRFEGLTDEHAAAALNMFATQATALRAWHESLRPGVPARTRQRDATRARWHFDAAAAAFLRLDKALGCPYGCKEPS